MVHDFSPFLFQFTENFGIRWYGTSYLLGFVFSYVILHWLVRRQRFGLEPQHIGDMVTSAAIGILVGGRLGYCLFYSPDLFLKFRSDFPFWGVLALNEGGMSSHGGMIGLVTSLFLFALRLNINQLYLFDLAALTAPIGIFFGRIANFINGELMGRAAPASFPYGVKFPQDILSWPQYSPEKLSSLTEVVSKIPSLSQEQWLVALERFKAHPLEQEPIHVYLQKIIESVIQGNVAVKTALASILETRYPVQIFSAFGEGLFLFLFLFLLWFRPRKPGIVGSWFLVVYSLVRITLENFRQPDLHIGFDAMGYTRGQWLSFVLLAVGLFLLVFFYRRPALAAPGWGLGQSVRIHRRN